jgi:hypothetical protein
MVFAKLCKSLQKQNIEMTWQLQASISHITDLKGFNSADAF